jgi:hypothetical protein
MILATLIKPAIGGSVQVFQHVHPIPSSPKISKRECKFSTAISSRIVHNYLFILEEGAS